jgi:hypothetical protein
MEQPVKVYCPLCCKWWVYNWDRKVLYNQIARPTKAMRLTCGECHDRSKFLAEGDRTLGKFDRMDDDE